MRSVEARDWDSDIGSRGASWFADRNVHRSRWSMRAAVVRRFARETALAGRDVVTTMRALRPKPMADDLPDTAFVWIPKTAGTSLWAALADAGGAKLSLAAALRWGFPGRGLITTAHLGWDATIEAGLLPRTYADEATTFTIVRDPFDRAVSLFEYSASIGRITQGISFTTFLHIVEEGDLAAPGLVASVGLSQARPQVDWVSREGDVFVDHVGRLETLPATVEWLEEHLGRRLTVEHRNASDRRPIEAYRTAENRALVERIYRTDYEAFGY